MKILFIAYSSFASPTGGGRTRVIDAAQQSLRYQHEVWILCFVRPEQWFTPSLLHAGKASLEAESGCPVIYIPRLPFTRFTRMTILNGWYCSLVVKAIARMRGIEIFHCHGLLSGWFGLLAKSNARPKVLTDVHGLMYEEARYAGEFNLDGGLAKLYQNMEREVLRKTDGVIFVSHAMQQYYADSGIKPACSTIIPCAVNLKVAPDQKVRLEMRQELGLENKLVFIYAGSAVQYQQIGRMCELFLLVSQKYPQSFFLVLTNHRPAFREALQRAGVPAEMTRIEAVPHGDVFRILQAGDVGLLLRDAAPVNRVSSPTKFGEYCACGVPVITTALVGDVSKLVLSNHLGCVIGLEQFKQDERLFAFLEDVLVNRADYIFRCEKFVREHYSWQYYGTVLSNIYQKLGQLS